MASLNQKNIWEFEKSFHLFPLGRTKLSGVFEKFFCFTKDPFTHLDKGGRNAHPFLRFSKKNFYSVKISPHLFGITKPNDTLFRRKKWENIFSVAGALFCLLRKTPFTYSHWEQQNAHPESQKFFIPSLIWNWEVETHPVFTKILKNIFFDWGPWFCLLKKSFHLFPLGRGKFQPCFKKYFTVCKTPSPIWN